MAMTNAERQRRFKHRALKDPDGTLLTRLEVLIGPSAAAQLDYLHKTTGRSKRELVEAAILAYHDRVTG